MIVVLELGFGRSRSWTLGAGLASGRLTSPAPATCPNTVALGNVIYTQYLVLFQAAGLVLLTAMIGAIVLTLQPPAVRKTPVHPRAERAHVRPLRALLREGALPPRRGVRGVTL